MSYEPPSFPPPSHNPNNPFFNNHSVPQNNPNNTNSDQYDQSYNAPIPLNDTDAELLAEAEAHQRELQQSHGPELQHSYNGGLQQSYGPEHTEDHHADPELDESLSWIPNTNSQGDPGIQVRDTAPHQQLMHPVAIPTAAPGLTQLFSRAWAPPLASYGVRREEFLAFIDHLNVCKSASPPLQVLNLAGTVLGFTPIPFAPLVGLGTSAAAGAATYATARVRITHYLERANKEYFAPRGLLVRIAKQDTLQQILGPAANSPLLAPLVNQHGENIGGSFHPPPLRDRRLRALSSHITPIEFHDLPAPNEEHNMLDKISAKMAARKSERQEKKIVKDSVKGHKDEFKEREKLMKEEGKIQREMEKVRRKEHGAKQAKELGKLERELEESREEYEGKVGGEGGGKAEKGAKKFLWIVVLDLQVAKAATATTATSTHTPGL